MILEDVFTLLAHGELQNLSMAKGGGIIEEKQPVIVTHINDALMRLYSRFVIKENELLLECYENVTQYHLKIEHTKSQGDLLQYIIDTEENPFIEDVIKVLGVTSNYRGPAAINDPDVCWNIRTPQPQMVQVPSPIAGESLSVTYQASHPVLHVDDMCEAEVELPPVLMKALTSYVAGKIYGDMNGQENMVKSQEQMSVFEGICAEAIDRDLVNTSSSSTNTKFHQRGWV